MNFAVRLCYLYYDLGQIYIAGKVKETFVVKPNV